MTLMCENIRFERVEKGMVAIVSGGLVSVIRLAVPPLPEGKLMRVLPNMMAAYNADTVVDTHFSLLGRFDDGTALIAQCAHTVMKTVQDMARQKDHKLVAIWPDYILLPVPQSDDLPYAMTVDGHIALRFADETGLSVPQGLKELAYKGPVETISSDRLTLPTGAGLASGPYGQALSPMALLLLLRRSLIWGFLALTLWLVYAWQSVAHLEGEVAAMADAEITLYRTLYPSARVVNVETQLRNALNSEGGQSSGDFKGLMVAFLKVMASVENASLDRLRFDAEASGGSLQVTVVSADFAVSEALKTALRHAALTVTDQGSRLQGSLVYSDLMIGGKTS